MHAQHEANYCQTQLKNSKPKHCPISPSRLQLSRGACHLPLNGAFLTEEFFYKATVTRTDTNEIETFTGLMGRTFKTRYNKHMTDFSNQTYERSTTLSKHIWKLKRMNAPYDISWEILSRARVFNPVTRSCQLCLREKYLIMFRPESATLNSRDKLFGTCRHRLKMLLGKIKT